LREREKNRENYRGYYKTRGKRGGRIKVGEEGLEDERWSHIEK